MKTIKSFLATITIFLCAITFKTIFPDKDPNINYTVLFSVGCISWILAGFWWITEKD